MSDNTVIMYIQTGEESVSYRSTIEHYPKWENRCLTQTLKHKQRLKMVQESELEPKYGKANASTRAVIWKSRQIMSWERPLAGGPHAEFVREPQTYLTRCLQLLIRGQLPTLKFAKLLGLFIRQLVSPFARLPVVNSSCLLCREKKKKKKWKNETKQEGHRLGTAPGRPPAIIQSPKDGPSARWQRLSGYGDLSWTERQQSYYPPALAVHQQLAHLLPAWFSCEGVLCWDCLDLTHA